MSVRLRRTAIAFGTLGFAALAISPGPRGEAMGPSERLPVFKGLSYTVEQKTISDADPGLVVECPEESVPTGGGTFIDTAGADDASLTNSTPQPAGDPNQTPDEGWLSEGNLAPAFPTATMISYAICAERASKIRYRSSSKLVAAGVTDGANVNCPKNTVATGGGTLTDSDLGDMIIVGSRPTPFDKKKPTGWVTVAHNYDSAPHGLVAYAICSKEEQKYSVKHRKVQMTDGAPGEANLAVNCPKNSVVSGGGAEIFGGPLTGDAWLTSSSPQPVGSDKPPKKGWIAEGISFEEADLDVWAICKK